MKKLIKSYKFWVTFTGAVGVFLMALSDTVGITINVDGVKETIMAFCGLLVVFGIVKKTQNTAENTKDNQEKAEENLNDVLEENNLLEDNSSNNVE